MFYLYPVSVAAELRLNFKRSPKYPTPEKTLDVCGQFIYGRCATMARSSKLRIILTLRKFLEHNFYLIKSEKHVQLNPGCARIRHASEVYLEFRKYYSESQTRAPYHVQTQLR